MFHVLHILCGLLFLGNQDFTMALLLLETWNTSRGYSHIKRMTKFVCTEPPHDRCPLPGEQDIINYAKDNNKNCFLHTNHKLNSLLKREVEDNGTINPCHNKNINANGFCILECALWHSRAPKLLGMILESLWFKTQLFFLFSQYLFSLLNSFDDLILFN